MDQTKAVVCWLRKKTTDFPIFDQDVNYENAIKEIRKMLSKGAVLHRPERLPSLGSRGSRSRPLWMQMPMAGVLFFVRGLSLIRHPRILSLDGQ